MIPNYKYTENAFLPKTVIIPLVQEKNIFCKPVIKPGEIVSEGQLIASSDVSVIHSPIPGIVQNITPVHCPDGKIEQSIVITTKGAFSYLGKKLEKADWQSLSPATLEKNISEKGIVNTFSCTKTVPLDTQIKLMLRHKSKTIVARLFDEDSLRISDSLMSKFYFNQIREGAKILAKITDADGILFVMNNKDIKALELENDEKQNIYFMGVNVKKYLTGFKHGIVSLFNKNLKKNCSFTVTKNDFFIDSYTLYDIYNAAVYNMPVLSRPVHFTGNCLTASCFLNVRTGFVLKDIINQLGGFVKTPNAVIINGTLCGNSINTLEIPITKYVKSVEFISKANTTDSQVYSCIKCGACRNKCPVNIAPDILCEYVYKKTEIPDSFKKTSTLCINCGLCNTVCQARIPLCQIITMLKNKMDNTNE